MKAWTLAVALALCSAGCGSGEPPEKTVPKASATAGKPAEPVPPPVKSDPAGKNVCMKCKIRTNDDSCPGCKTLLKAAATPPTPRSTGEVGKSAVAPGYACPKTGCKFTSARKETCLSHGDTMLQELWFVCSKCGVSEPRAGKCKCGAELARTLR